MGIGAVTDAFDSADAAMADGATMGASSDGTSAATAATDPASDPSLNTAGCTGGGLSFSADTQVATPRAERPIASLRVGDQVSAYDPTTGKATTQTITHVYLHHDTGRLDVTLALPATSSAQPPTVAQDTTTVREQRAAGESRTVRPTRRERHRSYSDDRRRDPHHRESSLATADRGWQLAGALHMGESVRLLDSATATVVALHAQPGAGPMWDLSLDATHTFAVGASRAIAHNIDLILIHVDSMICRGCNPRLPFVSGENSTFVQCGRCRANPLPAEPSVARDPTADRHVRCGL